MKKAFRAAIAVLFVLVFAVVGLSSNLSISASQAPTFKEPNLALRSGATGADANNPGIAFADSLYTKADGAEVTDGRFHKDPANINDGKLDDTFYWQPASKDSHYAGIYWEKSVTFNVVVIEWKSKSTLDSLKYATGAPTYSATGTLDTFPNVTGSFSAGTEYEKTSYGNIDVIVYKSPVTTQAVKVEISGAHPSCDSVGGEIHEIAVYNVTEPQDGTKILNYKKITATVADKSIKDGENNVSGNVVDDDYSSYWETITDEPERFITLDLGDVKEFDYIHITWGGVNHPAGNISISNDGEHFTEVVSKHKDYPNTKEDFKSDDYYTFDSVSARYVKMTFSFSGADAIQIREITVYSPIVTGNNTYKAFDETNGQAFVATDIDTSELPPYAVLKAEYTITLEDERTATGVEYIYNAYKSIQLGDKNISAKDSDTAYVAGIYFKNTNAYNIKDIDVTFTVVFAS